MYSAPVRFNRALNIAEITPEAVTERLTYRLRKMIGSGRRWSYYGVSALTQIDIRTLKAYVQGTACPNLVKYKRLLAVLGPEIGIELNIMKGWLPRSAVMPPEALDLGELRDELVRAGEILADILGQAGVSRQEVGELESFRLKSGAAAQRLEEAEEELVDTQPEYRIPLKVEDIDLKAVATRLGYRLRKMIGPGKRWGLAEVSTGTGIDRRTLQSYVDGDACPNLTRYHRLGYLLGPEIGVELAYMIGWEPRYGQSLRLPRGNVEQLLRSLREATEAIDGFAMQSSDGSTLRLVRPADRVGEQREDVAGYDPGNFAFTAEGDDDVVN
jgi:hypothetical protein